MFYREIEEKLLDWKNGSRKPLIVNGLRQVGKTTTILNFCKKYYENVVYIDFRSNPSFTEVFNGDFDIDRITSLISTKLNNVKFVPNKTIIFFDEIQECAKARASLKYFFLNKRFDVISSGSLLGVKNYNQDYSRSVSVGFETFLTMYPMSFKEFLLALKKDSILSYIEKSLEILTEIDPFIHNQLIELFRMYLVIGGMPEVVSEFIKTQNYDNVFQFQKDLITTYVNDFGRNINSQNIVQRDPKLFERILLTFESIPTQLAKENSKFKFSSINKGARSSSYYDAIEWLEGAGLVYKVKNTKSIESPLKFFEIDDQFKLYFADSGLLLTNYGKITQDILLNGNSGVYKGAIYENMICSSLIKKGIVPYYYQKPGRLEVDFVIETNVSPIAIEVKATNSKSKSLTTLATNPLNYGSKNLKCIKLYEKNISFNKDFKILNLPYYLIDFIDFEELTKEIND